VNFQQIGQHCDERAEIAIHLILVHGRLTSKSARPAVSLSDTQLVLLSAAARRDDHVQILAIVRLQMKAKEPFLR
jgi:hypothetical protein